MPQGMGTVRNTRQKALILACLKNSGGAHLTAEEIGDMLKARCTPVAKSTVYRYLSQLEACSQVRKYTLSDGQSACYQYIGHDGACMEHYHLMCKTCGEVVHFDSAALGAMFASLRDQNGFSIDGRRTVFYGLCGKCTRAGREID